MLSKSQSTMVGTPSTSTTSSEDDDIDMWAGFKTELATNQVKTGAAFQGALSKFVAENKRVQQQHGEGDVHEQRILRRGSSLGAAIKQTWAGVEEKKDDGVSSEMWAPAENHYRRFLRKKESYQNVIRGDVRSFCGGVDIDSLNDEDASDYKEEANLNVIGQELLVNWGEGPCEDDDSEEKSITSQLSDLTIDDDEVTSGVLKFRARIRRLSIAEDVEEDGEEEEDEGEEEDNEEVSSVLRKSLLKDLMTLENAE